MDVIPIKVPIEIYDAKQQKLQQAEVSIEDNCPMCHKAGKPDRKSTRLNSSHRIQSRMPSSA